MIFKNLLKAFLFATILLIKNNILAAVPEEVMSAVSVFGEYSEEFLDVPREKYFNSGILVVNTKKQGKVITHYYIEGTEQKVPSNIEGEVVEDVIQTGKIGDIYITHEAENVSDRYELQYVLGNVNGEIQNEVIEIYYFYNLKKASQLHYMFYQNCELNNKNYQLFVKADN